MVRTSLLFWFSFISLFLAYRDNNTKLVELASSHRIELEKLIIKFEKIFTEMNSIISKHPKNEEEENNDENEELEPCEEILKTKIGTEYNLKRNSDNLSKYIADAVKK